MYQKDPLRGFIYCVHHTAVFDWTVADNSVEEFREFRVRATSHDRCIYLTLFFKSLPHKMGSGALSSF